MCTVVPVYTVESIPYRYGSTGTLKPGETQTESRSRAMTKSERITSQRGSGHRMDREGRKMGESDGIEVRERRARKTRGGREDVRLER